MKRLLQDWYQVKTNMDDVLYCAGCAGDLDPEKHFRGFEFAVNYSAVFLGMMPAYLLSYDHASGWTEHSFALPLSKELTGSRKANILWAQHGGLCGAELVFCGIQLDGKTVLRCLIRLYKWGRRSPSC